MIITKEIIESAGWSFAPPKQLEIDHYNADPSVNHNPFVEPIFRIGKHFLRLSPSEGSLVIGKTEPGVGYMTFFGEIESGEDLKTLMRILKIEHTL